MLCSINRPINNYNSEEAANKADYRPFSCRSTRRDFISQATGEVNKDWVVFSCNDSSCIDCSQREAWRHQKTVSARIDALYEKYPTAVYAALRVGVDCHVDSIEHYVKDLNRKLDNYLNRRAIKRVQCGYVRAIEIKIIDDESVYVHVHLLLAFKPSFRSHARIKNADMYAILDHYFDANYKYQMLLTTDENPTMRDAVTAYAVYINKFWVSVSDSFADRCSDAAKSFVKRILVIFKGLRRYSAGGIFREEQIFTPIKSDRPQPAIGDVIIEKEKGRITKKWKYGLRKKAKKLARRAKEGFADALVRLRSKTKQMTLGLDMPPVRVSETVMYEQVGGGGFSGHASYSYMQHVTLLGASGSASVVSDDRYSKHVPRNRVKEALDAFDAMLKSGVNSP